MDGKKLRNGYTTGTCGAAAALAAAWQVFAGEERKWSWIELPDQTKICLPVGKQSENGRIWFFVKKDAGDDPDVTNGVLVYAAVEPLEFPIAEENRKSMGESRTSADWEEPFWYHSTKYPFLFLTGGLGIGVVTRPGLACPERFYAINPVPRAMIFRQVGELYQHLEMKGTYLIRLKIPQGVELAEKTFNPKLGIQGGISVLGTSGIVHPMSEKAMTDTIRLEIHMKAAEGQTSLILVPGNYGERFLKETLGISVKEAVHCSNFAADAVRIAVEEGMKKILFIGHVGKLIKVAGGVENTHSQYGDRRMEILAESLKKVGKTAKETETQARKEQILACNTTEEAMEYLEQWGWREQVMEDITRRIWQQMNVWGEKKAQIEVLTFSSVYGILGMSRLCEPMLREWREKQI